MNGTLMKWTPRKAWARLRRAKKAPPINWDDITIRIDPRLEDDEWYMEQVLRAPEKEWRSLEGLPDGGDCVFDLPSDGVISNRSYLRRGPCSICETDFMYLRFREGRLICPNCDRPEYDDGL